MFCGLKKSSTFAPQFRNEVADIWKLGYGVIGNTTDSGPVILGSSPGIPTIFLLVILGRVSQEHGFFILCMSFGTFVCPLLFIKKAKSGVLFSPNAVKELSLHKYYN